jgi:O-antigen ligase
VAGVAGEGSPGGHLRPRVTPLRLLLLAAVLLPSLVHLVRWVALGPEGTLTVLVLAAAFFGPALIGRGDATRTLVGGVALAFSAPLWPVILHQLPFVTERVALHGTFAALLLWLPFEAGGSRARRLRWLLAGWALVSLGSASAGFIGAWPRGVGGAWAHLADVAGDALVSRPQIEPGHALWALLLRIETLGLLFAALQVGLVSGGRRLAEALGRAAVVALLAGFAIAWTEMAVAAYWRGEDFFARIARGLGRMHRPLLDNNAMGSTLVLWLPAACAPLLLWIGARIERRRTPTPAVSAVPGDPGAGGFAAAVPLALGAGLFLLMTARSKAALGAAALAFGLVPLFSFGVRATLRRPLVLLPLLLAAGALLAVQLLPAGRIEGWAGERRYAQDAVRVLRLDAASDYLHDYRSGPWSGAFALFRAAPLFGHGLGSTPRRLGDVHDPERGVPFNPVHENAHNQVLQWAAEEGLLGLAFAALLLGAALLGLLRLPSSERLRLAHTLAAGGLQGLGARARVTALAVFPAAFLGLALNLQIGHSLLELGAAYPLALLAGLGLACHARTDRLQGSAGLEPTPVGAFRGPPAAVAMAAVALAALPLLGLLGRERPLPEDVGLGCFPWVERPGAAPPRDRIVAHRALWWERWGVGSRGGFPARDPRPFHFTEPLVVDLWLNGERVLNAVELPRAAGPGVGAETRWLRFERPSGVATGDLIEFRMVTRPPFTETLQFATGRERVGPRVGATAYFSPR